MAPDTVDSLDLEGCARRAAQGNLEDQRPQARHVGLAVNRATPRASARTRRQAAHVPLAAREVMEIGAANWVRPGELPPPPQVPAGPVDLNDPAWKLFEESAKQPRDGQGTRGGPRGSAAQAGAGAPEAPPVESIRGPAGQPGLGRLATDAIKGTGLAVATTVVAKVVTRETGSSTAGGLSGITLAAGVTYRAAGAGALAPAAVGIGATLAGNYAGRAITGTEAGGTAGGMAGAGAVGACFGGPVGAGGAVLIAGTVDVTDALMDLGYAYADGKELDHRLHTIWVHHAYGEILGRLPDKNGLEFHVEAANGGGSQDELRRRVARSREAQGLISGVFQHHLGRDAFGDEREAWTSALGRAGVSMRDLELALAASPEAGERRAARPN